MKINYGEMKSEVLWDDYKHFHKNSIVVYGEHEYPFTVFATGEVRANFTVPGPNVRGLASQVGLEGVEYIFTSDAPAGTFSFDPEGERPLPKTRMNQEGGQYLLWDRDSRRCVRLGRCRERVSKLDASNHDKTYQRPIPGHLVGAAAYSFGDGSKWVGNQKILVQVPDKELAKRWSKVRTQVEKYARALLSIHKGKLGGRRPYTYSVAGLESYVLAMLDTPNEAVNTLMDKALDKALAQNNYRSSGGALSILTELAQGTFKFPTGGVAHVDAIYFRPTH